MYRPGPIKVLFHGPWTYITCTRKGDGPGPHGPRMTRIKGLWAVLFEVEDADVREDLALVATAIQVHFVNRVTRERAVVEFMAIRFCCPASRTGTPLLALGELVLGRCTRDRAISRREMYAVDLA